MLIPLSLFLSFSLLSSLFKSRAFLAGWFFDTPLNQIKRINLLQFFAAGSFFKPLHLLTSVEHQILDSIVDQQYKYMASGASIKKKHHPLPATSNAKEHKGSGHDSKSRKHMHPHSEDKNKEKEMHLDVSFNGNLVNIDTADYNPTVKSVQVFLEPVKVSHHPLLWYAWLKGIALTAAGALKLSGFVHKSLYPLPVYLCISVSLCFFVSLSLCLFAI